MARPAKPRKLTTRQGSGDDNGKSSRGHPGHDAATRPGHSSLKSSGTSPNFFSTTASENSPTFGSAARIECNRPRIGRIARHSFGPPDRGGFALALLCFTWRSTVFGPDEGESNVIGYGHGGLLSSLHIVRAYFSPYLLSAPF